jgi:hypothetical protein
MSDGSQPGCPVVAGIRLVVGGENSAYNIFIELQAKRQIDLLCNAGTTVSWITAFHLDNGVEDLFGRSFWTWLAPKAVQSTSIACGVPVTTVE